MTASKRTTPAQHTPLSEWSLDGMTIKAYSRGIIASFPVPKDGGVFEAVANRNFVFTAVNQHATLVAELLKLQRHFERLADELGTQDCEEVDFAKEIKAVLK